MQKIIKSDEELLYLHKLNFQSKLVLRDKENHLYSDEGANSLSRLHKTIINLHATKQWRI